MHMKPVTVLVPALALALAAGPALAEELRAVVDKVDPEAQTINVGPETIYVPEESVLNGIKEGSRYVVRYEEEDGRYVLNQIVQDDNS
jgi:Protein of unknown function (DUF1344)